MTEPMKSDQAETLWQAARRQIAIEGFRFLMAGSGLLLIFGLLAPNGPDVIKSLEATIITIGSVFSLIVTGYMGLDLASRLRGGEKKPKVKETDPPPPSA